MEYAHGLLVFTRTDGYRHDSIPAGIAALQAVGADLNLPVDATEDPADLTPENLRGRAAVVFLNTIGDVLTPTARESLVGYLGGGGGFVGVHAAAATEPAWPEFGDLVGARFARHPDITTATVRVVDPNHPATAHLDPDWVRTDEWYDFVTPPRPDVRVLLALDDSTYDGGGMGANHPIAWCHEYSGGRCFYTAMGHTITSYVEPAFLAHLRGAVASVLSPR